MLIVDNVQLPVNWKTDTYESVMEAWSNALTQVEALVQGISQHARSGDILLALSSWHLYPDLTVVTPSMAHVRQSDPVFGSGGVLTIGLQASSIQEKGVYWSLPLAYLRHYGSPVVSARSIRSGLRSRLSLQELLQATLGSLLRGWGSAGKDTFRSLRWLSSMYHLLLKGRKLGIEGASILTTGVAEHSWLALLSEAANVYVESEGLERQHNNKLISLGRKHGKTFLGTPSAPVFGLLERGRFIDMIASEEERIGMLRKVGKHMAEQMRIDSSQIFIRYKHELSKSCWVYEYATAIPYDTSRKRKADGTSCSTQSHHRWLYSGGHASIDRAYQKYYQRICDWSLDHTLEGLIEEEWAKSGDFYRSAGGSAPTRNQAQETYDFDRREAALTVAGESVSKREDQLIEDVFAAGEGIYWFRCHTAPPPFGLPPLYSFAFGAIGDAALFITKENMPPVNVIQASDDSASLLYSMFEGYSIDKLVVAYELEVSLRSAQADIDPHLKSLKAISTAAMMFKHFPYASVDVRILQGGLYNASWIRTCISSEDHQMVLKTPVSLLGYALAPLNGSRLPGTPLSLQPYALSKGQAFACLAMFESGQHDIDPHLLNDVMAMSSGDSIYVSAALLTDPYDGSHPGDIRGVTGNIGRPGITFLVPPKTP